VWCHTGPFCIFPHSFKLSHFRFVLTSASPIDSAPEPLQCGRFKLTFERPLVMGILNVTPDSFSDGGQYMLRGEALRQAERMLLDGADMLDIGGESTRPGAPPVPLDEELQRVLPLVERDSQCGLCVMHMLGEPQTMQAGEPSYHDVVAEVRSFLADRTDELLRSGVARTRITVDPGFGFGKTVEHNYTLLAHLRDTAPDAAPPFPVLAGMSRKSMLGAVTGRAAPDRIAASVAAAVCAAERGAAIVRVHDVAQTVDALKVWSATRAAARRD
jgi:dihydropteroate synthase